MAKGTFPTYVHVTREPLYDGTSFLKVREDGVNDPDIDTTRPYAIYRLESVGEVHVSRVYVPNRPAPKRKR